MKKILIIQANNEYIDYNIISGSGKIAFYLFKYLSNNNEVYYALNNDNKKYKNIINIKDINYNLNYDLIIINQSLDNILSDILSKLNILKTKIIFIAHNNYYNDINYNFFKKYCNKIIFVSPFNYNIEHNKLLELHIKHKVLYLPQDIDLYKNININKNAKDIIMSYHPCKGYHKEFIDNIYDKIYEKTKSELYICFPNYGYNDLTDIINAINNNVNNSHIHLLNSLPFDKLLNIYKKCAVSILSPKFEETLPNTVMESCLTYTFPVSLFSDGAKYICSKNFINKYKLIDSNDYSNIINHISNIILNYNLNIEDIIKEKKYVENKFNLNIIINKWIKEINRIINL